VERTVRLVVVTIAVAAASTLLGQATATARADYGPGAAYQVEISSNPHGSGFWYWAELDPTMTSGDYQETDCIHLGNGGPNGALHDSGSVSGWEITGGTLTMHGVKVLGGAETVDVSVPVPIGGYGHSDSVTITPVAGPPVIAGTFPAQVQLAP
jgi:hypothetical protein